MESEKVGYEEGMYEGDGWGENEQYENDEEILTIGGKRKSKKAKSKKSKKSKSKKAKSKKAKKAKKSKSRSKSRQ